MKQATAAEILIVDDEERNRKLLRLILQGEGYSTWEAERGDAALAIAAARMPDLILLDLMLPGMDGFQVLRQLKDDPAIQAIPVIVVSAVDDPAARLRVEKAGAAGLLTKPIDRWEVMARVREVLAEPQSEQRLARQLGKALAGGASLEQDDLLEVVHALAALGEYGDHGVGRHLRRMSSYMRVLASALGLALDQVRLLAAAAPFHDVGMAAVPVSLRRKRVPLDASEWDVVRQHPRNGADLLAFGTSPLLQLAAEIALHHHEHWDGSGYPQGLAGEQIPLSARLLHLCDCYDALRRTLPYRAPCRHAEAMAALIEGDAKGRPEHFDPALLTALSAVADRFESIFEQLPDV